MTRSSGSVCSSAVSPIAINEAGESQDCDQVEVTAIPFFGSPVIIAMAALASLGAMAVMRARRS